MNKNRSLALSLVGVILIMFAFGFALIPLYNVLCKSWGLNGKFIAEKSTASQSIDKTRTVLVEFLATNNANLPWSFYPVTHNAQLHPGENILIYYYAKNNSNETMTVQAIPSISPGNAARYLKKTECFCFTRQTFKAGEERKMPVLFHLDQDLPKDIHTVSLSYTLFDTAKIGQINNKEPGKIQ